MSTRGIDHIGLTVPDIDQATAFFTKALGAQVLYDTLPREEGPKAGQGLDQRLGVPQGTKQVAIRMLALPNGPGLELFEFSGPRQDRAALPSDIGWQHLALYTDTLESSLRDVIAAGGTALSDPRPLPSVEAGPRNRFVYCRTPWGSTLELITYPDDQPYTESTELRRWTP